MIKLHNREEKRLRRFAEYLSPIGMLRGETLIHSPSIRVLEKCRTMLAALILQGPVSVEKGKPAVGFYAGRNFCFSQEFMGASRPFIFTVVSFSVILNDQHHG